MSDAASMIAGAIEQAVDSKLGKSERGGTKTVTATYEGRDADGKPYVTVAGATEATPVRRMSVQADVGDTVTVTIGNGMASVDSNVSNPSASASNLYAVDVKADTAQKTADEAVEESREAYRRAADASNSAAVAAGIAEEAKSVAEATNQHFWDDANGAHVTDCTKEEWAAAYEDGFSDGKPYHNALWNSLGMLFRSALSNLVSISRSAIAFFDGTGNNASNVIASFGTSGAQIGKTGEKHAVMDSNGFNVYDADGTLALGVGPQSITFDDSRSFALGDTSGTSYLAFVPNQGITIGGGAMIGSSKTLSEVMQDATTAVQTANDVPIVTLSSTNGTVFKRNTGIDTTLIATIFTPGGKIDNATTLHQRFGNGAYLQWGWRDVVTDADHVLLSSDERIILDGFGLVVSPEDIDVQAVITCALIY